MSEGEGDHAMEALCSALHRELVGVARAEAELAEGVAWASAVNF
jgi:hypothetical protein